MAPMLRRLPWYALPFLLLLLFTTVYFVFMSYGLLRSDQCTQQIEQLQASHQDTLMKVLEDLRKQVEKETDLLKKLNKYQMDEENLRLKVESLESRLKETDALTTQLRSQLETCAQQPVAPAETDTKNIDQTVAAGGDVVTAVITEPPPTLPQIQVTIPPQDEKPVEEDRSFAVNGVTRESAPIGHAAIILFTFNRGANLDRTLQSLLKYQPSNGNPIFVSQDGEDQSVNDVLAKYTATKKVYHLRFHYVKHPQTQEQWAVYYKIAAHYKFGLSKMFDDFGYEKIIIMEDDMDVAPDFFTYFTAAESLLDADPTLLCASAWNDNGQAKNVQDPHVLYRTDCFPGLGWMMRKELWEELKTKWPLGFWDDWLREPTQRKGRSCIYPEMNRVYTFGEKGASAGQFYKTYLEPIRLNDKAVDWQELDLKYLIKTNYDPWFTALLGNATQISSIDQVESGSEDKDYVMTYASMEALTQLLSQNGLMTDHKAGIPRASYMGVTVFRQNHKRVFFAPDSMLRKAVTKTQQ